MTTDGISTATSDRRLVAIDNWEEVRSVAVDSREYSGEGALVEDKATLAGRALVITAVKRNLSDRVRRAGADGVITSGVFVSVSCLLREALEVDGERVRRVVFNDGGVGIEALIREHIHRTQVESETAFEAFEAAELRPPLYCRNGLRPSHYTAKLPDGSEAAATTWYLT